MAGRDISASFSDPAHNSEIPFSDFVAVEAESNRVKALITQLISGTYLIKEDTYYVPNTKANLLNLITSELDAETILNEMMGDTTWDEFIDG